MTVLSMAYLYKAGQRSGLIKSAWKDMDFIILENHVSFKGGRPGFQPIVAKPSERADTFEMAAIFRAALGVRTVDLNTTVRPRIPAISHLAWRKITHKSDLIDAMEETHRAVDRLDCTDRESINLVLVQLSDAESKGKNNGRTTTKHNLVDFLETYERHLTASEPLLRFDYIGFLDILSLNMHTSSLRHRPGPKNAAPCSPRDFVDFLPWTAADVVKRSKHQSPEELRQTSLKAMFGRTVRDLDAVIEASGGIVTNRL